MRTKKPSLGFENFKCKVIKSKSTAKFTEKIRHHTASIISNFSSL